MQGNKQENCFVSERLREIRKIHGKTQLEIAEVLGMKRSTYAYYETGATKPSIMTLTKLATFYDIPLEFFTTETATVDRTTQQTQFFSAPSHDSSEKLTESEKLLVSIFRCIPDSEKAAVFKMLRALTD